MDGYFIIGTSFLDGYFLNDLVPWTGWFLNYRFFGRVPKILSCHIWGIAGSGSRTAGGHARETCEKGSTVLVGGGG